MSITLRNLEERDVSVVVRLLTTAEGESASSLAVEAESLKACLLADNVFALVAEENDGAGSIVGTVLVMMAQETEATVLGLLGCLWVADVTGRAKVAASLVSTALQSLEGNLQLCFAEIPTSHLWAQAACEQAGFIPCGFLPEKHQGNPRRNALVYCRVSENARNLRRPHPEIIEGVRDLATESIKAHGLIEDAECRGDVMAYPTEGDLTLARIESEAVQTILQGWTEQECEVFPHLHLTRTRLHLPANPIFMAARDAERVIGVIGCILDPLDKRVQITHMISLEGEIQGILVAKLMETLSVDPSPEFWETLVNAHATRMQKTFAQLGFVPCAYLPAFGIGQGLRSDAIKMVKLNTGYVSDSSEMTSACEGVFSLIDAIFRDYSVGNAVLKLLRDLRCFQGLGEGELRLVARLFSQKLFRPGELIFEEGSMGEELYVVERGEIEVRTKEDDTLLGLIDKGKVLGEIAFLGGAPRTARAVSKSAAIVRVITRSDFDRLLRRETHLGLIFFRNVAMDLAEKLRHSVAQAKHR